MCIRDSVKPVLTVVSQALDMLETSKEQKTINSNLFTSQIWHCKRNLAMTGFDRF